jgi:hypothetical protein
MARYVRMTSEQIGAMKEGEKAACGCEITRLPWTREVAKNKVYEALAKELTVDAKNIEWLNEKTTFSSLGFDLEQIRKLWKVFFVACDVDLKSNADGSLGYKDESKLPPMPQAIGNLIEEVALHYSGVSINGCDLFCGGPYALEES